MMNLNETMSDYDATNIVFHLSQELDELGYRLTMPCMVTDTLFTYRAIEHIESGEKKYILMTCYGFDVYSDMRFFAEDYVNCENKKAAYIVERAAGDIYRLTRTA